MKRNHKKSWHQTWICFNTLWSILCLIATIFTITWQLMNYINGRDATIVEYKKFHNEKIDAYPSIGMCFSKAFNEEKLRVHGNEINRLSYSSFLSGGQKKLAKKMFQIDYDEVTLDFENFIIKYGLTTNSWKDIVLYDALNTETNISLKMKPEFKTHSIFGIECFSIDIPYKPRQKLARAYVFLTTNVFPSGIRPSIGENPLHDDAFMVTPYYPNQFYRQINVAQRNWPVRDQNSSKAYMMEFNVRNVEVLENRNKYHEPCIEGIPDFDDQIPKWIIERIGCKPPYWKSLKSSLPLCSTLEQVRNARDMVFSALFGTLETANYTGLLPCRSLEKIQYDARDIDFSSDENNSYVKLLFNFREFTYKEVKSVRGMDLQALVGKSLLKN